MLPHGGWTALMLAARQNAVGSCGNARGLKADLNASIADGTTALQLAIINLHYDLATLLLNRGADPNVADSTGMTALYAAVDMRAPAEHDDEAGSQAVAQKSTPRAWSKSCFSTGQTRTSD